MQIKLLLLLADSPQPRSQYVFPFLNLKKGKSPGNEVVCTVAVMSSVADMSSDVM